MDLNLEKTTRQTTRKTTNFSSTGGTIVYDATVPNFALDATHAERFGTDTGLAGGRLAIAIAAAADAIHLCQEGAIPVITAGDVHASNPPPDTISLISYNGTTEDITDGLSQLLTNTPPTTIGNSTSDQAAAAPLCQAFFEADLSTSSTSTSDVGSKTQSLQGTGIEFGYDFEKYSLSFNQLQWSGGDDKFANPNASFPLFFTLRSFCGRGFCERQTRHRIWFGFGHSPRFSFWLRLPHHQKLPNQLELCLVGSQPCSAGYPVCYFYAYYFFYPEESCHWYSEVWWDIR